MNNDLRDYLLEMYLSLTAIQNQISKNKLAQLMMTGEFIHICSLKLTTAKLYHKLAEEKDLNILDEDGYPSVFQLKRMAKIMSKSAKEYVKKVEEMNGENGHFISLSAGDIILPPKKEPSKCDDCGHVHD